ncbi:MAG: hypothetical protein M1836_004349 [Candelina mexicana]|nr:MAG: hypothetical protein M1836_004349 [Candelina mexicana]
MSDTSSPSQAPDLAEVHPEVYLKGSKIIYGKEPSNRAAEGLDEVRRIASLSDEERSKVHSIEIAFQWQDIPRDEFEQHKNTVRSEIVAGRPGFWSLSQEERTYRVHDKYREEIIKIWIAKFAALDAFNLGDLQVDIREFSCKMWCCTGRRFLAEVGNLLPMLKNPLPRDITILARDSEIEELLRSILDAHSSGTLG